MGRDMGRESQSKNKETREIYVLFKYLTVILLLDMLTDMRTDMRTVVCVY